MESYSMCSFVSMFCHSLRCITFVGIISILILLIAEWQSRIWIYHICFTYLWTFKFLQLLVITSKLPSPSEHASLWSHIDSFLLGEYLRVCILSARCMFHILLERASSFPQFFYQQYMRALVALHLYHHLDFSFFLILTIPIYAQ